MFPYLYWWDAGVLLTLPAGSQQHVAALCEHWIKQQLANWNVMVGNTFIWLLQEAGEPQAQVGCPFCNLSLLLGFLAVLVALTYLLTHTK